MVSTIDLLFLLLRWVHLLGGTVWIGGLFINYLVIRPVLATYQPSERIAILRRLIPRFLNILLSSALITVSAGTLLAFYRTSFTTIPFLTTLYGYSIITGATLSLIMLLLGFAVALPASRRFISSVERGAPSQEIAKSLARIQSITRINLILGSAVIFTMAFAVFSFQL